FPMFMGLLTVLTVLTLIPNICMYPKTPANRENLSPSAFPPLTLNPNLNLPLNLNLPDYWITEHCPHPS
ncbi:MAG TPA: hypothetical protein VGE41_00005, partial [Verrucomicrobiae bacterium]